MSAFRVPLAFGLALTCLAALAPTASAAATTVSPEGVLSPRLAELSRPAVRALSPAGQARRLDLPGSGPASLMRRGSRVVAEVRLDAAPVEAADALRAAGAEVLDVSGRYQTVTVAAPPADLPALAAVSGVAAVTEVLEPIFRGVDCGGSVRSEGDLQLDVPDARGSWGVDGSGVTVGILSDSFDRAAGAATHAAGDVASGDLPGPGSPCGSQQGVGFFSEANGTDEGRAMAQIVHDLAPGAGIDFATAAGGQQAFANGIRALAGAGAKVIVDDAIYLDEPFFQDGPVAAAINQVVASGVTYVTAAGNDNIVSGGKDVGSLEAQFASAGSCPAGVPAVTCADFDPGPGKDNGYDLEVAPGEDVLLDLQWAEPWGGVQTDLDAYLVGGSGNVLAKSTNFNVSATQRPFEAFEWTNETSSTVTVRVAIPRVLGGGTPRFKFVLVGNGASGVAPTTAQYGTSSVGDTIGPTVIGHSGAASAISAGAVGVFNPNKPENYSSRGPAVHFFGPVAGTAPAAPTGEVVVAKPDLVASDCGATTFFSFFAASHWRFCGTSAAAPHVAAIAALMAEANPGAGPARIREALVASGRAVGSFGVGAVGAGLPDASAAVAAVALAPAITITNGPPATGRNRQPLFEFRANRPVAFACSLDGAPASACTAPYRPASALSFGKHSFVVSGTDLAGRTGSSRVVSFVVAAKTLRTRIAKHPPKLVRTKKRRAKVSFRFSSSEAGTTFVCRIDSRLRRSCPSRLAVRLGPGRHQLSVKAVDAEGVVDPTPASVSFRVERIGRAR